MKNVIILIIVAFCFLWWAIGFLEEEPPLQKEPTALQTRVELLEKNLDTLRRYIELRDGKQITFMAEEGRIK